MGRAQPPQKGDGGSRDGKGSPGGHAKAGMQETVSYPRAKAAGPWCRKGQALRHNARQQHADIAIPLVPYHHKLTPSLPQAQEPGCKSGNCQTRAGLCSRHHLYKKQELSYLSVSCHRRIFQKDYGVRLVGKP